MKLVYDWEADGLLDTVTKLHCGVFKELNQENWYRFQGDFSGLPDLLREAEVLICHNQLGYDLELMRRMLGIPYTVGPDTIMGAPVLFIDTMDWSRRQNPDRRLPKGCPTKVGKKTIGPHGLDAWAFRTGGKKPVVDDWVNITPEAALHRCEEDVRTNELTYKALLEER